MSEETTTKPKNRNQNKKPAGSKNETNKKEGKFELSQYVSNVDGNIYAITGLPEEFIATLFAWVSRSPKSFKEHLQIAAEEFQLPKAPINVFEGLNVKAKNFHEKWTVGYGHSSVAEHAVAHVGIEKVSRLASAELELSNQFYSITEYSQRYQRPERGEWHNPFPIQTDKSYTMWDQYEEFMHKAFDTFETLIDGVYSHLLNNATDHGNLTISTQQSEALKKLAFEDARYVLPLSMHTQLGMTANGRAWRDGIAKLGTSDYPEVTKMADDLRTEITKVLPVLLKYATPSKYQINSKKRINAALKHTPNLKVFSTTNVKVMNIDSEIHAINEIIALMLVEEGNLSYSAAMVIAKDMKMEEKIETIKYALHEMDHFDNPPEAFKTVKYQFELLVSEANWHQLLRHNRKTEFNFGKPSPYHGVTIPPRIKEAGLEKLVWDLAAASCQLFEEIKKSDTPELADYVILNAHQRQVVATFNLWEAYHLINLRTSEEAQWDIRDTFEELFGVLKLLHPNLIYKAQRR
jgi:thymidylate synthase ThyX